MEPTNMGNILPRRVVRVVLLVIAVALLSVVVLGVAWQFRHRHYFGHFADYGIHTDLLSANEDWGVPGVRTSYAMKVTNLSFRPVKFQAIKLPGGFAGYGFLYHEVIQRWDSKKGWVTYSDSSVLNKGRPWTEPNASVTLWPGQSIYPTGVEALGAKEGMSEGDKLRILIFPKFEVSTAEQGEAIYSRPFRVHR